MESNGDIFDATGLGLSCQAPDCRQGEVRVWGEREVHTASTWFCKKHLQGWFVKTQIPYEFRNLRLMHKSMYTLTQSTSGESKSNLTYTYHFQPVATYCDETVSGLYEPFIFRINAVCSSVKRVWTGDEEYTLEHTYEPYHHQPEWIGSLIVVKLRHSYVCLQRVVIDIHTPEFTAEYTFNIANPNDIPSSETKWRNTIMRVRST